MALVQVAQLADEAVVEDAEVPVGGHLGGLEQQDLVLVRGELLQPVQDRARLQHLREVDVIAIAGDQGGVGGEEVGPLPIGAAVQREEDNNRLLLDIVEVIVPDLAGAVLLRLLAEAELLGAREEMGVGVAGKLPHVLQALPAVDIGRDEEVFLVAGADQDEAGGLGRQDPEAGPDQQRGEKEEEQAGDADLRLPRPAPQPTPLAGRWGFPPRARGPCSAGRPPGPGRGCASRAPISVLTQA